MEKIKEPLLTFDDVLEDVGSYGPFQKRFNWIFNFSFLLFATMPYFIIIMVLSTPDHWCNVPGRNVTNYTIEEWRSLTIPKEIDSKGRISFSKCRMFNVTELLRDLTENTTESFDVIDCQHGWTFDKTWYTRTVVSEKSWVCEEELFMTNTYAFSRIGELLGSFTIGQLGDLIGRKPVFLLSLIITLTGKMALTLTAANSALFMATAVISSLTGFSIFSSPLIIATEISNEKSRAMVPTLQLFGWTIGMSLMPLIMWAVGDWVYFVIITTLPCTVYLFLYRYIIESPRWLLNKGKIGKCVTELQKIAKVNGRTLPEDTVYNLRQISKTTEKVYGAMSLFTHWRIAKNSIGLIWCWAINTLCYLVLYLNTANLGGNPFLNFFYQGVVELPAYLLGKYCCDYFGRRWTHVGGFIATSFGFLPLLILIHDPDLDWLITTITVILRFLICFTFYGVNLHALEMYPTCLRQTGMSLGVVAANAIGILSPFIVLLGTSVDARYPYIILAVLGLFTALYGFLLPETLHQKLPETVAEAKIFGMEQKYCCLPTKPKQENVIYSSISI